MDGTGIVILVVGAVVLGVIGQYIGQARYRYEWVADGIGALVGGYVASELLGSVGEWGPEAGGLFLLPALIGGIIVGGAVWLVTRNLAPAAATRGS